MQGIRRFVASHKKRLYWGATGMVVLSASVGGVAYYYYHYNPKQWLINHRKRKMIRYEPAPVRRTPLYVAGKAGTPELPLVPRSMPRLLFYVFVVYRMARLFLYSIPIVWYAVLTFVLHTCSRGAFYELVRQFLTDMGPSYIKLGQWMASRPDVFPHEFCETMEKLYDQTSAHKWSHTEKLLRQRLTEGPFAGHSPLEFLTEIERKPVNSGSIAQIHRAKLRVNVDHIPAGTELAIKVSHPHIAEEMAADVAAMKLFVSVANVLVPGIKSINLTSAVREFAKLIRSQLNLLIEADNLRQFTYNFREVDGIIFPKPLISLCTEEVLFETFEWGESLQTVQLNADTESVAELGCHMFLKMLFEDNFVHSDLHPGNIFLRHNKELKHHLSLSLPRYEYYPDGKRKLEYEIVVLDAGLVTTLSKRERNNFISLFAAVACGDGELGASLMLDRMPQQTITNKKGANKNKNEEKLPAMTSEARKRFTLEMKEIFDMVAPGTSGFRLSNVQIGAVLAKILNTVRENKAPLDGNFAALVLTVIVGEGLGRRLSPEFNIFSESAPYLVAFLEEGELYFLASKLRETYGTPALLRESMHFVQPARTNVYMKMAAKRGSNTTRKLLTGETSSEIKKSKTGEDEEESDNDEDDNNNEMNNMTNTSINKDSSAIHHKSEETSHGERE